MSNTHTTIHSLVFAGLILASGLAVGQSTTTTTASAMTPPTSYGKFETAPGFMYIHNSKVLGMQNGFNCVGAGGTFAYNFSRAFGFAADLGGCKVLKQTAALGPNSPINGNEFTFLFGPRITLRSASAFQPFGELSLGGTRAKISCINGNAGNNCGALTASQLPVLPTIANPNATSFSRTAFTLSVGGGFNIKINKKFSLRPIQAEYMYTRFGNSCPFAVCSNNNSQNSFRLKSGIVMSFGQGGS